jgi:hypothetical protein
MLFPNVLLCLGNTSNWVGELMTRTMRGMKTVTNSAPAPRVSHSGYALPAPAPISADRPARINIDTTPSRHFDRMTGELTGRHKVAIFSTNGWRPAKGARNALPKRLGHSHGQTSNVSCHDRDCEAIQRRFPALWRRMTDKPTRSRSGRSGTLGWIDRRNNFKLVERKLPMV